MFMRLVTTVEWCVILSYMTSLVRLVGVETLEGGQKPIQARGSGLAVVCRNARPKTTS